MKLAARLGITIENNSKQDKTKPKNIIEIRTQYEVPNNINENDEEMSRNQVEVRTNRYNFSKAKKG